MTAGDASEFATLANDAGDAHLAAQFMDKIANLAHVRKSVKRLRLAYRIYGGAGDYAKMSTFLDLYLEQSPRDAEAWIDRATLALATGNSAKAEESLLRALAADREKAVAAIEKDPKLLDLAQEAISRRQRGASGVSLPGF